MPRKHKSKPKSKSTKMMLPSMKRETNDPVGQLKRFTQPRNFCYRQLVDVPLGTPGFTQDGVLTQQFAQVTGALNFTLNLLDQVASFTALYDQYRIVAVGVHFRAICNQQASLSSSISNLPARIYTCIDHDDATPLSTIGIMRQNARTQENTVYKDFIRWVKPHSNPALAGGGLFTRYGNVTSPWIDTYSPDVAHFGLKYIMTGAGGGSAYFDQINVQLEYFVEFRDVI